MKVNIKAVGRLIVTLIVMGAAMAFMFMYPKYSGFAILFVLFLLIWDFMYYKDFKKVKASKNSFELETNNEDEISKINDYSDKNKGRPVIEQDTGRAFERMHSSIKKNNGLSAIGPSYSSPELLSEFIDLRDKANSNRYDLEDDHNYHEIRDFLVRETLSNLAISTKLRMTFHGTYSAVKLDLEVVIPQSFYNGEIEFNVLQTVQNQIEKVDHDPNISISFSKAKSDLKKLQA